MSFSNQTFRFVPVKASTTSTIYNVSSPGTANTEFSQALSSGTKQLIIRMRSSFNLQISFNSGESGTDYIQSLSRQI